MFTWIVTDLKLMSQRGGIFLGNEKIYSAEHETSREDKIAFVDEMQNGKLSYILALAEKLKCHSHSLLKTQFGDISKNSLRAWLDRNDYRSVINNNYLYGRFTILGCTRMIDDINCESNFKITCDTYEDLVDELFHRQLKECERMEREYFEKHDEYSILSKSVRQKMERFGTAFGANISYSSSNKLSVYGEIGTGRHFRDITLDELKELECKFAELEAFINKLSAETHIIY